MPSRSPKMKRRIFGFQRRVWWPKWTPASSSSRMPTWVAMKLLGSIGTSARPASRGPGVSIAPGRTRGRWWAGSGTGSPWQSRRVSVHPLAAHGFADVADAYERGRPEYPAEAVAALGLPRGARVLDLAAGTGKFTRRLLEAGLHV